MFVQVPQVVDDGDISVAIYQLIASEWLVVFLTPCLEMILQTGDIVEQQ
jgi:hypothetical protein